jgi:hypothetical protein
MKINFKKSILMLLLLIPLSMAAQDKKPDTKESNKPPISSREKRRESRRKWKEQNKTDKIHADAVEKHHKRLQTKKTLKRMKAEKKKSEEYNSHK